MQSRLQSSFSCYSRGNQPLAAPNRPLTWRRAHMPWRGERKAITLFAAGTKSYKFLRRWHKVLSAFSFLSHGEGVYSTNEYHELLTAFKFSCQVIMVRQ